MSFDCVMSLGSDNTLLVKGVYNTANSEWVNDATVTVTLLDANDEELEGQDWPTSMPYVTGSDGNYRCILHETIEATDGQIVTAVVTITADGLERTLRLQLQYVASTAADLAWTSKDELERLFGRSNVAMWADLENTEDQNAILEQIQWAVVAATEDAKLRLTGSHVIPSELKCIPQPLRIATTKLAGVLLYSGRGVKDTSDEAGRHRLSTHQKQADDFFKRVRAGTLRLGSWSPAPGVVKVEESDASGVF